MRSPSRAPSTADRPPAPASIRTALRAIFSAVTYYTVRTHLTAA